MKSFEVSCSEFIIFLILLFVCAGCELIPDLERDNIYDENYSGDNSVLPIDFTIKDVDYVFSYVTNGGTGFSPSSKTYVKIV
jgi:molybdopterin biosynthesis enzyme MoaB